MPVIYKSRITIQSDSNFFLFVLIAIFLCLILLGKAAQITKEYLWGQYV